MRRVRFEVIAGAESNSEALLISLNDKEVALESETGLKIWFLSEDKLLKLLEVAMTNEEYRRHVEKLVRKTKKYVSKLTTK